MAGLNAGLTYNTFPLMDGELIPSGYGMMTPWIANLFENIAAVQFNHRLLAVAAVTLAMALWLWSLSRDLAPAAQMGRSEEHTSELQSLMRISYAVFFLKENS